MNTKKRWYDKDPTVSLAISLIRNTKFENQIKISKLILERTLEYGVDVRQTKKSIFGIFKRRWYDINEDMYDAIESLRISPFQVQKQIALEVINYLCEIDEAIESDMV